jgi:hypothetical protein
MAAISALLGRRRINGSVPLSPRPKRFPESMPGFPPLPVHFTKRMCITSTNSVHFAVSELSVMRSFDGHPFKAVHYRQVIRSLFTQWKNLMHRDAIHSRKFTPKWKTNGRHRSTGIFDVQNRKAVVNNCIKFAGQKMGQCLIHQFTPLIVVGFLL